MRSCSAAASLFLFLTAAGDRADTLEGSGKRPGVQILDDGRSMKGLGTEVRELRDSRLEGPSPVKYLADPRLIHIPDEGPGRAKWRLEFRRGWRRDDRPLPPEIALWKSDKLGSSDLGIRGLWINPTIVDEWPTAEWANLVIGRCTAAAAARFPKAPLECASREEGVWLTIKE